MLKGGPIVSAPIDKLDRRITNDPAFPGHPNYAARPRPNLNVEPVCLLVNTDNPPQKFQAGRQPGARHCLSKVDNRKVNKGDKKIDSLPACPVSIALAR